MSSAKNYEIMSALLDYYVNQYLGRRDEMFNTDKLLLKFSTFPFFVFALNESHRYYYKKSILRNRIISFSLYMIPTDHILSIPL